MLPILWQGSIKWRGLTSFSVCIDKFRLAVCFGILEFGDMLEVWKEYTWGKKKVDIMGSNCDWTPRKSFAIINWQSTGLC